MKVFVFSTPYCAKCPGVKMRLKQAGIEFEEINAIKSPDAVKQYDVKGVPTVIVDHGDNWETFTSENVHVLWGDID